MSIEKPSAPCAQSATVLQREVERLTAEVGMLRGEDCEAGGDGPCGVCLKCLKQKVALLEAATDLTGYKSALDVLQALVASEWLPIAQAPRDGTFVILWDARQKLEIVGRYHRDSGGLEGHPEAGWIPADSYHVWDDDQETYLTHFRYRTPPPPSAPPNNHE